MKFEEKMKKNKNFEISHIVRLGEAPEVYNQKQNTLFIFECVEHRRLKVTWASLWVYSDECSSVCTVECTGWACGSDARLGKSWRTSPVGPGLAVRDARLGWGATRIFVMHDSDGHAARLVVVHGLVRTRPQFGRDARIGCTRAKLYGHDRTMWLVFRNDHMQLKVKACN